MSLINHDIIINIVMFLPSSADTQTHFEAELALFPHCALTWIQRGRSCRYVEVIHRKICSTAQVTGWS